MPFNYTEENGWCELCDILIEDASQFEDMDRRGWARQAIFTLCNLADLMTYRETNGIVPVKEFDDCSFARNLLDVTSSDPADRFASKVTLP